MKNLSSSLNRLLILIAVVAASCAPVYVPNARNVPMFDRKGEVQLSAAAGMGYNLQGAYAVSDHIGVTGNFLFANNKAAKKFAYRTQQYAELGAGYYSKSGNFHFEVYGGFGAGKGSARDTVYYFFADEIIYKADASYQKFFVQPSIGTKVKNFNWSVSTRLSSLNYNKLDVYYGTDYIPVIDRSYWVFEPSLNLRISMDDKDKFFLMLQSGFNMPLYRDAGNDFNIEKFHGVVGLQLKISRPAE